MIRDEIDYLYREYLDRWRGNPDVIRISPENLAILREELELEDDEDLTRYHGMDIQVDEDFDALKLCSYEEI